jgi:hypothetical protein
MILLYLGLYFLSCILFCLWEAAIGFGKIKFDGRDWPPPLLGAFFWPLFLVLIVIIIPLKKFDELLNKIRTWRDAKKAK